MLLRDLLGAVVIPQVVLCELKLDEPRPGVVPLAEAVRDRLWLSSLTPPDDRTVAGLGAGESTAIRLAQYLKCPLLIDERRGRANARNRGVAVIGTGRILLAAKERGLIVSVADTLTALRGAGYRLSDELCSRLLSLAKEPAPQVIEKP